MTADAKLVAAWEALDPETQKAIRAALAKPTPVGAVVAAQRDRNVKTAVGYVVSHGFVTPLARELIEAVEFGEAAPKPAKKRKASGV